MGVELKVPIHDSGLCLQFTLDSTHLHGESHLGLGYYLHQRVVRVRGRIAA